MKTKRIRWGGNSHFCLQSHTVTGEPGGPELPTEEVSPGEVPVSTGELYTKDPARQSQTFGQTQVSQGRQHVCRHCSSVSCHF